MSPVLALVSTYRQFMSFNRLSNRLHSQNSWISRSNQIVAAPPSLSFHLFLPKQQRERTRQTIDFRIINRCVAIKCESRPIYFHSAQNCIMLFLCCNCWLLSICDLWFLSMFCRRYFDYYAGYVSSLFQLCAGKRTHCTALCEYSNKRIANDCGLAYWKAVYIFAYNIHLYFR